MPTGTIVFFDPYKGFGSILAHDTNKEIFVHINGLIDQVYKDNQVTFDLTEINGKVQAINVVLLRKD